MKLALIGNCQIESIASCLRVIAPKASIELFHSWNLESTFESMTGLVERLRGFDIVLSHRFYKVQHLPFDELLTLKNFVEFPVINFSAFHPDCVYLVEAETRRIVRSVTGDYNSALIAYSYVRGLSQAECQSAFREGVYDYVGYFATWATALEALNAEFCRCGLDVRNFATEWLRHRPFMHSINHPRLFAIKDIVAEVLRRKGAPFLEISSISDYVSDPLLNYAKWPIYPEIGSLYGVAGDYLFKNSVSADGQPYVFTLADFIKSSYESYAASSVKQFASAQMEAWDKLNLVDFIRS